MSTNTLDLERLENVREQDGKTTGACPACREQGKDRKGEHLVVYASGHFGCILFKGDSPPAKEHRSRIFALAGTRANPGTTGPCRPLGGKARLTNGPGPLSNTALPPGVALPPPPRSIVCDDGELEPFSVKIARKSVTEIAVAAETTPEGRIRTLTVYAPCVSAAPTIVEVSAIGRAAFARLLSTLGTKALVVHGAQDLIRLLARWYPDCHCERFDFWCTWIAAKLLSNGLGLPCDLEVTLKRHLNVTIARAASDAQRGATPSVAPSLARMADTARHLLTLKERLARSLADERLARAFALELRLLPVTHALNSDGWSIDLPGLRAKRERLATALATPGSTNTAPLRSRVTQIDGWLRRISPDGRLRCKYNSLGAVTGRFSASEPNLQGVPRDLREAFCAGKGCSLVIGDLSQIELRIAALVAGDRDMLNIFRRGRDLHRMTAAAVLHKAVDDVTNDERQLGKAANFGLIYGQKVPGFERYARDQGVDLPEAKATRIRDRFFKTYVGIAGWHRRARNAISPGTLAVGRTVTGRRRLLASGASAWQQFQAHINYAVQGSAAELFKTALVELHSQLEAYSARLVGVVHDEVIVEAPNSVTRAVTELLECTFEEAFVRIFNPICELQFEKSLTELFRNRPACEIQTHVCMNWAEKG